MSELVCTDVWTPLHETDQNRGRSTVRVPGDLSALPGTDLRQVRIRVLNDDLAADFARWHPGFTHHNGGRLRACGVGIATGRSEQLISHGFGRSRGRGGLSNNGTASGDSGLKSAGLSPLAVPLLLKPRRVASPRHLGAAAGLAARRDRRDLPGEPTSAMTTLTTPGDIAVILAEPLDACRRIALEYRSRTPRSPADSWTQSLLANGAG